MNRAGGILLAASEAEIQKNNIANNGEWELKLLENHGRVDVKNNWWGSKESDKIRVIGPLDVKPVLEAPIDVRIFGMVPQESTLSHGKNGF